MQLKATCKIIKVWKWNTPGRQQLSKERFQPWWKYKWKLMEFIHGTICDSKEVIFLDNIKFPTTFAYIEFWSEEKPHKIHDFLLILLQSVSGLIPRYSLIAFHKYFAFKKSVVRSVEEKQIHFSHDYKNVWIFYLKFYTFYSHHNNCDSISKCPDIWVSSFCLFWTCQMAKVIFPGNTMHAERVTIRNTLNALTQQYN